MVLLEQDVVRGSRVGVGHPHHTNVTEMLMQHRGSYTDAYENACKLRFSTPLLQVPGLASGVADPRFETEVVGKLDAWELRELLLPSSPRPRGEQD